MLCSWATLENGYVGHGWDGTTEEDDDEGEDSEPCNRETCAECKNIWDVDPDDQNLCKVW